MSHQTQVRLRETIELRSPESLRPVQRNARTHSRKQLRQIASSIQRFGFTNPILVDGEGRILAGHGRVEAAKILGMGQVPVLCIGDLSPAERKAYALADNKIALNAGWDQGLLALELQELIDLGFEVELTGFCQTEIDLTLDLARESDVEEEGKADAIPPIQGPAVSCPGDLWLLGRHRLLCGDAREAAHYDRLMGKETADLVFTDPPYNVPIDGHVCGSGRVRHREFAMGAGEMTSAEFVDFLSVTLGHMIRHARSGAILYVCMDWRHIRDLCEAGEACGLELKNLVVWNKTNGGMGTFYRSKHELIFVFKFGDEPHTNNFGLGESGRYRTNVWDYPGISSISAARQAELEMHPTVKPVALVADALRDCSRRADLVLDPFAGSGTTLIAAQQTGRRARLIEFDPLYCDTILRRFTQVTGLEPRLEGESMTFDEVAAVRLDGVHA
ncbi:MAG: site-specific DNA-methyltransferase [Novosphingobium sp.]|nr:site-specific DNA-methyltransferase [Novosphingobium sp.]